MRRRKLRIRRWLTLAVALGALSFASSASAIPLVDHDGGGKATSAQANFTTPQGLKADGLRLQGIAQVYKQIAPETSYSTPQGLKADGLRLQGIAQVYQSQAAVPDVLERYAAVHPYGAGLTPAATRSQSSGFDWGDYAIGIGTGVGFILLLVASLAFGSQHRRRMQPA